MNGTLNVASGLDSYNVGRDPSSYDAASVGGATVSPPPKATGQSGGIYGGNAMLPRLLMSITWSSPQEVEPFLRNDPEKAVILPPGLSYNKSNTWSAVALVVRLVLFPMEVTDKCRDLGAVA